MSVYGYCRVSTVRQASEGDSLEFQKRQIEGYAHMHALSVERVFVEEGVSGSTPIDQRPIGGHLFSTLCRGDVLIAAKLDRLFRSALDALSVVEAFKARGVKLHLLDLGGDIAGNGLSKLFLTIAAAFAEAERDRIRERVSQSKADQRAQGRHLGGKPPFGWRVEKRAGERGGWLVEVPEQQAVIPMIHEAAAEGYSLRKISAALVARGIKVSHEGVKAVLNSKS